MGRAGILSIEAMIVRPLLHVTGHVTIMAAGSFRRLGDPSPRGTSNGLQKDRWYKKLQQRQREALKRPCKKAGILG